MLCQIALLASVALSATMVAAANTGKPVMAGYFPGYQNTLSPDNVSYKTYTHLDYFVFTTTPSFGVSTAGVPDSLIQQFVKLAKGNGTSVSYTVGGYTGSQYFSAAVSTPDNRNLFANNLYNTMVVYGFDGIDIDWEYPGGGGEGDNGADPQDAANLLLFLQVLRSILPNARLSMAVQVTGIRGADGNNLADLSGFAAVLDYITIMVYDVFGDYSSTTGPNSPVHACLTNAPFSYDTGLAYYLGAGIPASKILIGFPSYAYAYTVTSALTVTTCDYPSSLAAGRTSFLYQQGGCGGNYAGSAGQYQFRDLAALNIGVRGSAWSGNNDALSISTYAYNPSAQIFLPYDSQRTGVQKAQFIKDSGLAGINIFSIDGDNVRNDLASVINYVITGRGRQQPIRSRY